MLTSDLALASYLALVCLYIIKLSSSACEMPLRDGFCPVLIPECAGVLLMGASWGSPRAFAKHQLPLSICTMCRVLISPSLCWVFCAEVVPDTPCVGNRGHRHLWGSWVLELWIWKLMGLWPFLFLVANKPIKGKSSFTLGYLISNLQEKLVKVVKIYFV